jgi:pimeloyl-ACP methyl ester carboxylesterase
MTETKTYTLDAPGCVLHYDIRENAASAEPPLLMIGSPMGAAGFATQASHFADRTVVTYDPRSSERSQRTDGKLETTPDEHADDLRRIIEALGKGPVDIFASSGGAVNALALVAKHPELVRTLVAHEPPAFQTLPDHEAVVGTCVEIHNIFQRSGTGPAMAKFIALASYEGPVPDDFAAQPGPDPAMFGMSAADDGSRENPLVGQNMVSCPSYQHDFDAIRAGSTRVVLGVGTSSAQLVTGRSAVAVAERIGSTAVTFPGGHDGFLGGEYGGMGEPDAFAAKLREVLTNR